MRHVRLFRISDLRHLRRHRETVLIRLLMSKKASADFRQALLLFRPLKTRLMYGRINRIAAYPPETEVLYMHYDIIIIGAGPGGIFTA